MITLAKTGMSLTCRPSPSSTHLKSWQTTYSLLLTASQSFLEIRRSLSSTSGPERLTTSILFFSSPLHRQYDTRPQPALRPVFQFQPAAVAAGDAVGDGEAEAGAAGVLVA